MSVPRLMVEDLTPDVDRAAISRLGQGTVAIPTGYERLLTALLPGLRSRDFLAREAPVRANTVINQFLTPEGGGGYEYPSQDFRMEGWAHASSSPWWGKVAGYMLRAFEPQWLS